ncbi:unnamed protein product [Owenia fusiformis]|uniref:Uncharacterized protein n=1 Tax=Owenia fusiformis TaxID=6347 RepID=A0A8S4N1I0_OWEFU|nr:unnamed protein product [Owenia fusiformis]
MTIMTPIITKQNICIFAYMTAWAISYLTTLPVASAMMRPNQTFWSTSNLPNPKTRFLCRGVKSVPSYFCDPEHILEHDEALSIQRRLQRIHMSSTCSCAADECNSHTPYSGYEFVVILVSNIISVDRNDVEEYIDTRESYEELPDDFKMNGRFPLEPVKSKQIPTDELANAVLSEKWKLGHCGDYALLTYATNSKTCVFTHGSTLTTLTSSNCHLSMRNSTSNNITNYIPTNSNNRNTHMNNNTHNNNVTKTNITMQNMSVYQKLDEILSYYESHYFYKDGGPRTAMIYAASTEPVKRKGFSLYVLAPILIFASFILIVLFLIITDKYILPWYRNRLRCKDEKIRYRRKLDQMNGNDSKMSNLHKEDHLLEAESVVDADEGWWWDESGQRIRHESGEPEKVHVY